jgi:hypothetical protein
MNKILCILLLAIFGYQAAGKAEGAFKCQFFSLKRLAQEQNGVHRCHFPFKAELEIGHFQYSWSARNSNCPQHESGNHSILSFASNCAMLQRRSMDASSMTVFATYYLDHLYPSHFFW